MRVAAVLVTFAGATLWAAEPKDDQVKAELKKLEGTWQMVTEERDGVSRKVPDRWFIKGNRYTVSLNGTDFKAQVEYQITIDPTKKPKQIETAMEMKDIVTKKPYLGTPLIGIYEINGDTLRICYEFYNHREVPRGRPDSFAAPKGSNTLLYTFKRVK
ncbi:MAG TPA: TIGR03067 domain-containing protein [Gemmataceae bacterium]|jgi:uncharacterized protein (TIGR03067 family)|nr:TIGR03067 domain-containing protein [Gemmataceae bacterium]